MQVPRFRQGSTCSEIVASQCSPIKLSFSDDKLNGHREVADLLHRPVSLCVCCLYQSCTI
eukprot:3821064-Amphidinium_carterae.1